jgi:hypothetical protein
MHRWGARDNTLRPCNRLAIQRRLWCVARLAVSLHPSYGWTQVKTPPTKPGKEVFRRFQAR